MKPAHPQLPRPTQGELEILHVLWERGSSSVRDVYEVLARNRSAGYTTVLKLLQIMTEKGLVKRDDHQRTHLYQARLTREQTQRQMVDDLLERAFGGSASRLVLQALAARKASAEEIAEIRDLLDRLEGGAR
jgi:predicted transcriptional regulator